MRRPLKEHTRAALKGIDRGTVMDHGPRITYISGPIAGTEDYRRRFYTAESALYEMGRVPVNPLAAAGMYDWKCAEDWEAYCENNRERILAGELLLLAKCDAIYMLRGWEGSRGANREYGFAVGIGLEVIHEGEA